MRHGTCGRPTRKSAGQRHQREAQRVEQQRREVLQPDVDDHEVDAPDRGRRGRGARSSGAASCTSSRGREPSEPVDIPLRSVSLPAMIDARRLRVLREVVRARDARGRRRCAAPHAVRRLPAARGARARGRPAGDRAQRPRRAARPAPPRCSSGHANLVLAQLEAAAADVAALLRGRRRHRADRRLRHRARGDRRARPPPGCAQTHPRLRAHDHRAGGARLLPRARPRRRRRRALDGVAARAARRRPALHASARCAPTRSTPCCPPATGSPRATRSRWRSSRRSRSSARPTARPATT